MARTYLPIAGEAKNLKIGYSPEKKKRKKRKEILAFRFFFKLQPIVRNRFYTAIQYILELYLHLYLYKVEIKIIYI